MNLFDFVATHRELAELFNAINDIDGDHPTDELRYAITTDGETLYKITMGYYDRIEEYKGVCIFAPTTDEKSVNQHYAKLMLAKFLFRG